MRARKKKKKKNFLSLLFFCDEEEEAFRSSRAEKLRAENFSTKRIPKKHARERERERD